PDLGPQQGLLQIAPCEIPERVALDDDVVVDAFGHRLGVLVLGPVLGHLVGTDLHLCRCRRLLGEGAGEGKGQGTGEQETRWLRFHGLPPGLGAHRPRSPSIITRSWQQGQAIDRTWAQGSWAEASSKSLDVSRAFSNPLKCHLSSPGVVGGAAGAFAESRS